MCHNSVEAIDIGATIDAKTKATLSVAIDWSLYVHIKEKKSTKELWNKLKELFDDSKFYERNPFANALISI